MNPEEFAALPEAKASVAVNIERLGIHANLVGTPITLTTVEGVVFKLPSHLQEEAKRVIASGVPMRGKRGRLPKLFAELDLASSPDPASVPSSSSREVLIAAVVESISGRLEENGACPVLLDKIADHISGTVTLDQLAEVIAKDYREEVLARLSESMVARLCRQYA